MKKIGVLLMFFLVVNLDAMQQENNAQKNPKISMETIYKTLGKPLIGKEFYANDYKKMESTFWRTLLKDKFDFVAYSIAQKLDKKITIYDNDSDSIDFEAKIRQSKKPEVQEMNGYLKRTSEQISEIGMTVWFKTKKEYKKNNPYFKDKKFDDFMLTNVAYDILEIQDEYEKVVATAKKNAQPWHFMATITANVALGAAIFWVSFSATKFEQAANYAKWTTLLNLLVLVPTAILATSKENNVKKYNSAYEEYIILRAAEKIFEEQGAKLPQTESLQNKIKNMLEK